MEARLQRTAVVHDPHPLWQDGLRSVLERAGVDVVGTATDERRAAELVRRLEPELLVTSSAALVAASGAGGRLRAIVIADSAASPDVEASFAAGASAHVVRTAHVDDLATAVRQTFARTVYTAPHAAETSAAPVRDTILTRREREILILVADGRSNAEVASLLWITRQTVKFHLARVYRKLGVANRTEAARWAHEHGLLVERAPALAA